MCECAAGGKGGVVQRAFLLLCPAPPTCLELDHVLKATTQLVTLSARALVSKVTPKLYVHKRQCFSNRRFFCTLSSGQQ